MGLDLIKRIYFHVNIVVFHEFSRYRLFSEYNYWCKGSEWVDQYQLVSVYRTSSVKNGSGRSPSWRVGAALNSV